MKLLGNRVHLQQLPPARKSAGGIHYSEHTSDDRMQFRVLAVGPGRKLKNGTVIPIEIRPGDYALSPLHFDHITLPDHTIICDASQLIATWPAPPHQS